MFCPNCGAKIEDESIFCPECGTKIETKISTEPIKLKKAEGKKFTFSYKIMGGIVAIIIVVFGSGKLLKSGRSKPAETYNISAQMDRSEKDKLINNDKKNTNTSGCRADDCDDEVYKNGYCYYHYGYNIGNKIGRELSGEIKDGLDDLKDVGAGIADLFK